MPEAILCLNAGSSSLKFALYRMGETKEELLTSGTMRADPTRESSQHGAAVRRVFADLEQRGVPAAAAIGHRLVHGGPAYAAPRRIDAALLAALRQVTPLAPLHLPGALEVIEACRSSRSAFRSRAGSGARRCDATAFTGCPTNTSSACSVRAP